MPSESSPPAERPKSDLAAKIRDLGPWFHNLRLDGIQTAPDHFLGDYPAVKWRRFSHAIPSDLRGKSVLDIGCNAGFYCLELKRRGASRVLGIDSSAAYLAQARFAAEVAGENVDFRLLSVYDVADLQEQFDIVLFLGVFYHLRYPLLALDLLREYVVKDLLVVQSMCRGADEIERLASDYPFSETNVFDRPGFPKMHFIEQRYSADETNWWIPNNAALEAMLRSSGFAILDHPESEVYLCQATSIPKDVPDLPHFARRRHASSSTDSASLHLASQAARGSHD
ncbi:MAG TPA: TIGR04290 family methyltransferase [Candidatus Acidoferrales bacterium]|nr:TIGR04290 family methyltransferase [Candidatus Acidoferrales bacterium]